MEVFGQEIKPDSENKILKPSVVIKKVVKESHESTDPEVQIEEKPEKSKHKTPIFGDLVCNKIEIIEIMSKIETPKIEIQKPIAEEKNYNKFKSVESTKSNEFTINCATKQAIREHQSNEAFEILVSKIETKEETQKNPEVKKSHQDCCKKKKC